MSIKQSLTHNIINIPGWHTNRHIVVIESDDWGSIRMPSKEVYEKLLREGIKVNLSPYSKYDSLATASDLNALFEVLTSVKDSNGHHAVLTADCVVANPDFEKIKDSSCTKYYYEPFTETLRKSPRHKGTFELWKQGLESGIFIPQLHGREHLNAKKWLNQLQRNNRISHLELDYGIIGLSPSAAPGVCSCMSAFSSGLDDDIAEYNTIITEGQQLFEKIFGYKSKSFIATTYTWNPKIEMSLRQNGVKFLQGMVSQHIPLDDGTKFKYKNNNFCGYKSKFGLTYLMRNCYFEPSQGSSNAADCLERVKIAFRWHKPATISMHRLNVIGAIDESNRTRNLAELKWLLREIIRLFPDVEFISSDQLGDLIIKSNNENSNL